MGGHQFENRQFTLPRTLVLVGKTGNGKSGTGNSILGKQGFRSKRSSSGVTRTSEMKTTTLEDGQKLKVIDTPGLFDPSLDSKFIGKEIGDCIHLAREGVDAFLFVISVRSRFGEDDKAAISSLVTLFGDTFYNYMIIVFTGGDELEDDNESLEGFLNESPSALKDIIGMCGNRCVLFDNKTKDRTKRLNQVPNLMFHVNMVSKFNGGKPYTNEIFTEMKKLTRESHEEEMYGKQFMRIYAMIDLKLIETTVRFEKLLEEERNSRRKAEDEIKGLRDKLEEVKRKEKAKEETGSCNIM